MLTPLDLLPDGFRVQRLADTGLTIIDGFCTEAERLALIAKAEPWLKPSAVVDAEGQAVRPLRTSRSAVVLAENDLDARILPVAHRAAWLAGVPPTQVESLHVVRYGEGEHYATHSDAFDTERHAELLERDGQRLQTFLIYLDEPEPGCGGATEFPLLRVRVSPRRRRAVHWINVDEAGQPRPEMRHGGLPVTSGSVKWIANAWIRDRPWLPVSQLALAAPAAPRPLPADAIGLPDGVERIDEV